MNYSRILTMIPTLKDNDLKTVPLLRTIITVTQTYQESDTARDAVAFAVVPSAASSISSHSTRVVARGSDADCSRR